MEETKQDEAIPQLSSLVERMEKANAEHKDLLKRQEELAARNLLGGKTDAGIQPIPPLAETPKEYADRILKGKRYSQ
jgi:hypothetical protein